MENNMRYYTEYHSTSSKIQKDIGHKERSRLKPRTKQEEENRPRPRRSRHGFQIIS
jgi:hypothetical protein